MRPFLATARPFALAFAAIALSPACGLLGDEPSVPDAGAPSPVAHLEKARGDVTLERGGAAAVPAKLGYLFLKDTITTGADGAADVRFGEGQLVEIGPDARFTITKDDSGIVLNVERGLIMTRNTPGSGPSVAISILTPFGLTRLGPDNSSVQVQVGKDGAQVEVLVGSVEIVSKNGQKDTVAQGDKATLTIGEVKIERPTREINLQPLEVVVHVSSGKSELRLPNEKKWKAIPRDGEILTGGETVRVKSGRSTVEIKGSQTQLKVNDGSELVFQKVGRAEDAEETSFELNKGSFALALSPGQKSRVELAGLQMESELGGQFNLVKTRDGYDVESLVGDVKLTHNGNDTALLSGQTARLSKKGKPQVSTPPRQELNIPTRGGVRIHHPGMAKAALHWSGEQRADYWIELGSDPKLEQLIMSGMVHTNFINVAIPRRGKLYWRVRQSDRTTDVDKGWAEFSGEPQTKDLARLRNEVKDGAEKTTIFFQDKPPAVTFTYETEPGAVSFRIQIYRAKELDKPMVDRTEKVLTLQLEGGVLTEGHYLWSVTPLSSTGSELRGGKMNKLEMSYDNSVPNLVITSPRNGESASGPLRTTGVAPVGARLYVNGKPADLDEKNRFDLSVTPVGQPPLVIFRVSRPPAPETITVRALRRAR